MEIGVRQSLICIHRNNDEVVLIDTSDVLEGKIINNQFVLNKNLKEKFKKTLKKEIFFFKNKTC